MFTDLRESYGNLQPSASRLATSLVIEALDWRYAEHPDLRNALEEGYRKQFDARTQTAPKRKATHARK